MAGIAAPAVLPIAGANFVKPSRNGDGLRLFGSSSGSIDFAPASTGGLVLSSWPAAVVGCSVNGPTTPLADMWRWNPAAATAGMRARITAAGRFSCSSSANGDAEVFGEEAGLAGANSCSFFGYQAGASVNGAGARNTFFGAYSAMLGSALTSGTDNVGVGHVNYTTNVSHTIALGAGSTSAGPTPTGNNQFVAGSNNSPMTNVFFGKGPVNASPTSWTLNGTGGTGTNIVGGNVLIAPGKSTGNAAPAAVIIQSTAAGASGATAQTLTDTVDIRNSRVSITGSVNITPTSGTGINTVTVYRAGSTTQAALLGSASGVSYLTSYIAGSGGSLSLGYSSDGTTHVGTMYGTVAGNWGIGIESFGTSAAKVFSIANGTAPGSSIADSFQQYSADISAGVAAPHFRTEDGKIVRVYQVIGWALPTATLTRTTFDPATVTLPQLAERVAALITDLYSGHQLLGA